MPVCSVQQAAWMLLTTMMTVTMLGVPGCLGATPVAGWTDLNLPEEHVPYYLHNHPHVREQCAQDEACPYKVTTDFELPFKYKHNGGTILRHSSLTLT